MNILVFANLLRSINKKQDISSTVRQTHTYELE